MSFECRTHLPCSQAVVLFPLEIDLVTPRVIFNHGLVFSRKCFSPGDTHPMPEVAHVHPLLLPEAFPDLRANALQDFARVADGRLASACRRNLTEEKQLERKGHCVRMLVVRKYLLARRIVSRGVNVFSNLTARRRAFAIFQQLIRNSHAKLLEVFAVAYREVTEKYRAIFHQLPFDKISVSSQP